MGRPRSLPQIAWGLSLLTLSLSIISWGQGLHWQFGNLSTYRLFPVFGLVAFSLMWSMAVVGALRRRFAFADQNLKKYYYYVGSAILIAIVMHPMLLIWQLWRDGFGLPPLSYENYVGTAARWAVIVSSLAWFIFLAYELRRWFDKKLWWRFIVYAGDLALVVIFFHSLRLGTNLQHGWFHLVWWAYGLSLSIILFDKYLSKHRVLKP